MSDLLNQASLVMVPSGYKEDTVYSVVPSDGSGDLSFTRASNGTRVNSAGLVEVCPWNLVEDSETFNLWATNNSPTITANNLTAPNGTMTADTFQTSTNISGVYKVVTVVSGSAYTFSVYIKNISSANSLIIGCDSNPSNGNLVYNAVTNTITSVGPTITNSSVQDAGNGWYRVSGTYVSTGSLNSVIIYSGTSSSIQFGVWGVQLNIGSTAKPYFPTTDRLNVPRLTYQNGGGGCPSLLLEKQSTNLVTYSDVLQGAGQWGYTNEMTITEVSETNPMGVSGCLKFTTTSANADHRAGQTSYGGSGYVAGDVICATAFVKASGYNYVKFGGNFGDEIAWFNLSNGTVASQQSNVLSAKIENFGNGWYRITNVYTFQNTIGNGLLYFNLTPAPTADSVYTGNGTSGCFAFGGQIEKNSSYPTSYIPTTSSSATRVADYVSRSGLALTNSTFAVNFKPLDYVVELFDFEKTGGGRMFYIAVQSNGFITFNSVSGGTIGAVGSVIPKNQTCKLAFSLNASTSNVKVYINGSIIGTYATNITTFGAFFGLQSFGYNPGTQIEQISIFPSVLTDAECQSLTT